MQDGVYMALCIIRHLDFVIAFLQPGLFIYVQTIGMPVRANRGSVGAGAAMTEQAHELRINGRERRDKLHDTGIMCRCRQFVGIPNLANYAYSHIDIVSILQYRASPESVVPSREPSGIGSTPQSCRTSADRVLEVCPPLLIARHHVDHDDCEERSHGQRDHGQVSVADDEQEQDVYPHRHDYQGG